MFQRNVRVRPLLLGLSSIFLFSQGGYALEELGKIKLDPLEGISEVEAGQKEEWMLDGEPFTITITSVEDGVYQAEASDGCKFSGIGGTFGPALSWKNCSGHTGSRKITSSKGKPFPMTKKTKFSFKSNGRSSKGESWQDKRLCKVKGSHRIRIVSGEYDTYKLVCSEGRNVRTYYVSPEAGRVVAFRRFHETKKEFRYTREFVKLAE